MARDFEDHCWKDIVPPEELEVYKHYERDTYVAVSYTHLTLPTTYPV